MRSSTRIRTHSVFRPTRSAMARPSPGVSVSPAMIVASGRKVSHVIPRGGRNVCVGAASEACLWKNDPVAVAVVHSRDKEPLTERIQDCAEDRDRRLTPNEAAVELDRVL